ncbi:F-box only protein 3 [Stegastes partitus]|uniref:F-box only protein 3 n=1 Tax=Stegastes partitus TaxID=144197 RepID=A0A9Y4NJU2_9TELE|nr:PREDICTED: F-box only protein 3 [Stegastes partitus]
MAASTELRMDELPSDPLLHILSYLAFRDLVRCSYVSRRLNDLSKHNPLWKSLCCKHWLLTDADRLQSGVSWYCLFRQYYTDLGRYIQYYPVLKRAWEQLKAFLQQRCPRMIASLKVKDEISPASEAKLTFYPLTKDQTAQDPSAIDMFITGSCFLEWFTTYVHNVVTGEYPIIRDQIFRYVHDKGCVATTGDITVSVSTSFLPELSSVHPPHFFFTYRIRIEMSSSASPEAACQLDSRYWKITTSDGNVEEVQGPGVVGEFPVMTPGKVHEYASCTTFSTPSEYMEGHYTFHRLANKEEVFHVAIPRFHMVCPPFREPVTRTQKASASYSARFDDHDDDGEYCDGDGDDFGDLRGINMAALEGAWCPRHI